MKNIFLISDTHFGHEKIITYCNRPFKNVEEMDETMIDNWNNVVRDQDIVYHLGDVFFNTNSNWHLRLRGHKRLVLGNHDTAKDPIIQNFFEKIFVWRIFKEHEMILTHVPMHPFSLREKPNIQYTNVHGHIHDKSIQEKDYLCVSVEHTNYAPISIEDVKFRIKNGT